MTCIVSLKHDGKIWLAGDGAASNEEFSYERDDVKVFKREGYVFGFTTSFRMGDLLKYKLKLPRCRSDDVTKFMVVTFIDSVIECFKENGFGNVDDNGITGGSFLVGYRGHVYNIDGDFQVAEPKDKFYSIGSGAYFALGAMYAACEYATNPEEILTVALEAASKYSMSVKKPFTIIHS